jgi:hypothetical protein
MLGFKIVLDEGSISYTAQLSGGFHGKASDLYCQCCWVVFPFFSFITPSAIPIRLQVKSNLRL